MDTQTHMDIQIHMDINSLHQNVLHLTIQQPQEV